MVALGSRPTHHQLIALCLHAHASLLALPPLCLDPALFLIPQHHERKPNNIPHLVGPGVRLRQRPVKGCLLLQVLEFGSLTGNHPAPLIELLLHIVGVALLKTELVVPISNDLAPLLPQNSEGDEDVQRVVDPAFNVLLILALNETVSTSWSSSCSLLSSSTNLLATSLQDADRIFRTISQARCDSLRNPFSLGLDFLGSAGATRPGLLALVRRRGFSTGLKLLQFFSAFSAYLSGVRNLSSSSYRRLANTAASSSLNTLFPNRWPSSNAQKNGANLRPLIADCAIVNGCESYLGEMKMRTSEKVLDSSWGKWRELGLWGAGMIMRELVDLSSIYQRYNKFGMQAISESVVNLYKPSFHLPLPTFHLISSLHLQIFRLALHHRNMSAKFIIFYQSYKQVIYLLTFQIIYPHKFACFYLSQ